MAKPSIHQQRIIAKQEEIKATKETIEQQIRLIEDAYRENVATLQMELGAISAQERMLAALLGPDTDDPDDDGLVTDSEPVQ